MTRLLPWTAAAAMAGLIAWVAGVPGVLYAPVWLLASLPGVPLGRALTDRHAFGWVFGLALGYATTCLVIWALIAAGVIGPVTLAGAWLIELVVLWLLARRVRMPWVTLPALTSRHQVALAATLLLVPLLMAAPYRNLGGVGDDGTKYYRAYFTADFVWHAALTAELARFEMPPRNPYLAREPLHYYWTYFLVPAAAVSLASPPLDTAEPALKINAIATAAVLIASFYFIAWSAGGGALATLLAVALVAIAASAEGLVAIHDLWRAGTPLERLREMNVDAITAWKYGGLRIDGVHRTMFYTPQHGLSCALGLLALVPLAVAGAASGLRAAVVSGVLLGLATTMNPFLGAAFSLIYGLAVLIDAARSRAGVRAVLVHAVAAVPPALAVAWGTWNAMAEGAGEALTIGWYGHARKAPVVTLLMSLGPALLPALAGLWPSRRLPSPPLIIASCGLVVGLGLLYFVVLSEASWVGFRAGQILIAMLTVLLARLFSRLLDSGGAHRARRGLAAALAATILAIGAPTVIADTYNASDIANLAPGPGFPWTLTVTPRQQEAVAWVRRNTRPTAVVQMDTLARGRGHWSFIPTFAARRMAAGLPISLLPRREYQEASEQVRSIFDTRNADDAHRTARRMRIDYLWVDQVERQAYREGIATLASAPGYFDPVFDNGEVTVYYVK